VFDIFEKRKMAVQRSPVQR